MPREQLIACFDIEASGLDPMFAKVLCGVVKPWGEEPKLFSNRRKGSDDSKVVESLITELNKYTILIAHNGVFYDRKFLNGRALRWNLPFMDPKAKMIDPWRLAKNHLNFRGNSLARLADFLGTEHSKTEVSGNIWMRAALDNDPTAHKYIEEHCVEDVYVLEEIADRFKRFIGNVTAWGSA